MPRVLNNSEDTPKRAVRKRAPRRTASKSTASSSRVAEAITERVVSNATRKAPTTVSNSPKKSSFKKIAVFSGFVLVVFGAAAGIGLSDAGRVDVDNLVNISNQQQANQVNQNSTADQGDGSVTIPVQNTPPPVAVSSMRGRGVGSKNVTQPDAVPVEPVEGNSTTTATSTDPVVADEPDGESDPIPEEES